MVKQNLLLVDDDAKGLRVMEVSLRNAGHSVTTAANGQEALGKLDLARPALILADTQMPVMDGYELCRRVKSDERYRDIPFIFLTDQSAIEDKIRGLELGADDYLTKPIYIKEIITRVSIALQKRERTQLERKDKRRFFGSLEDMGMVDLLQTIELGRKSGLLTVDRPPHQARLYFNDGQVVDAETGKLRGEDAVYRLLTWEEGNFEIDFKPIERPRRIQTTTQGLLMEGMRRVDEWGRLLEQLPSIHTIYQVDYSELAERLAELPDEVNALLRLFDGHRTALQAIDDAQMGDLEALAAISRLYFEGVIYEVAQGRAPDKSTASGRLPGEASGVRVGGEAASGARLEDWLSDVMADGPSSREHDVLPATTPPPRFSAPPRPVDPPLESVWPGETSDGLLPPQPSGLVDELLSSVASMPAIDPDSGLPTAEPAPPRGGPESAESAPSLMRLEHPDENPEIRAPLPPATLPPDMAHTEDSEHVRRALSLKLDELPPDAFPPVEDDFGPGALTLEALGDPAPPALPPPPATPAVPPPEGEELFFQGPQVPADPHDAHDLHFEEHKDQPISKAAWVTAAFLGVLVLGGGLFWGLRDTVEPVALQNGVLEQNWHEEALKTRGPVASAPALDAAFAAVREAPPPEPSAAPSDAPAEPSEPAVAAVPSGPPSLGGDTPPTEPTPAARADFRRLLDEGLALHEKRKYREAVEKLERALALATGNATVLLAYAQTLMELDRGAEALRAAEKCAAIEPNNARAWLIIGSVKQDKGDLAGAKAAYAEYIKLAPTDRYAEDVRRVIENIQ